jgi:hypothetical protein
LFPRYGSGVACYTGDGGAVYDGGIWRTVTKESITARLANHGIRVLLCSDAASEGLNLQVASALINYDLPWNPARVEQRIGRVDRIGQQASDIRVVNLMLAESVDERVYQVLSQRCDLFQSYVGAMQPVLSVARRMLLGVQRFDAAKLKSVADDAQADALASAAFEATDEAPPAGDPAGVTISDLARAFQMLQAGGQVDTPSGPREVAATFRELGEDAAAVPLSPFNPDIRGVAREFLETGERPPLVFGMAEQGPFRVVAPVWVNDEGHEFLQRAERLEALLGMWNGAPVPEAIWKEAHLVAQDKASVRLHDLIARAEVREREGLQRQVDAARDRLLRELARFLAVAAADGEDFNAAFHRSMQRGGPLGALLLRAYELVGYPEWPVDLVREATEFADALSANQRKNVLLGTPLEAAVRDPRWAAVRTLAVSGT